MGDGRTGQNEGLKQNKGDPMNTQDMLDKLCYEYGWDIYDPDDEDFQETLYSGCHPGVCSLCGEVQEGPFEPDCPGGWCPDCGSTSVVSLGMLLLCST